MQAKLPWLSPSSMLIHRSVNVLRTAFARRYSKISTITMTSAQPAKWFDSLPTPVSNPAQMSAPDLHELFQSNENRAKVLVVDVRRADIEGDQACMIINAINLPAQTFHQTLPNLISILSQYNHVVFHCSSSNGRGPRCAAWYEDALLEKGLKTNAYILTGGIKKWIELYPSDVVRI